MNSTFSPTPRGIFYLSALSSISQACNILDDPPHFRAALLVAVFAFFRMPNVAPHSRVKFDPHILVKWTKTLQEKSAHHFVQVPSLRNKVSCPVSAIQQLLASRKLVP